MAQGHALLRAQHQSVEARLGETRPPRLWLAGFAMHSNSRAFQGDLEAVLSVTKQLSPSAMTLTFSNELQTRRLRYPFATAEVLREALAYIGKHAHAADRVIVFVSTHGLKDLLTVNVGGSYFPAVRSDQFALWLEALGERPTLIVLSACHSGSFIPVLAKPNRIIYTAASAERKSFGCAFEDRNTFFVEELLRDFEGRRSLQQLFEAAGARIAERERSLNLLPSEPSSFIGAAVREWATMPIAAWLESVSTPRARPDTSGAPAEK